MKISEIKNWFEVAIPEPTIEQACIQIGCHYEEVAEMAEAINDGCLELEAARVGGEYKSQNAHYLDVVHELTDYDKVRLLDALCDQMVTAVGVAHTLGMDIEGALSEVNRSNHSKFENGKAVFNEQGKISKGKDYFPPELAQYIHKSFK